MRISFSQRVLQINNYIKLYESVWGRKPTVKEIAEECSLSQSTVKSYLKFICEIGLGC